MCGHRTLSLRWQTIEDFLSDAEKLELAKDLIEAPPVDRDLLDLFCTETEWTDGASIDLRMVSGSIHPDYTKKSWYWLLLNGKRMPINLDLLFRNPSYYFSEEKKLPSMSYLAIGNKLYVYMDGNHRTCIARFLFGLLEKEPLLSGVEIFRKTVDLDVYEAWCFLKKKGADVLVDRKCLSRADGPGWMAERFELKFTVIEEKRVLRGLSREDLLDLRNSSSRGKERSLLKRIWSFVLSEKAAHR